MTEFLKKHDKRDEPFTPREVKPLPIEPVDYVASVLIGIVIICTTVRGFLRFVGDNVLRHKVI